MNVRRNALSQERYAEEGSTNSRMIEGTVNGAGVGLEACAVVAVVSMLSVVAISGLLEWARKHRPGETLRADGLREGSSHLHIHRARRNRAQIQTNSVSTQTDPLMSLAPSARPQSPPLRRFEFAERCIAGQRRASAREQDCEYEASGVQPRARFVKPRHACAIAAGVTQHKQVAQARTGHARRDQRAWAARRPRLDLLAPIQEFEGSEVEDSEAYDKPQHVSLLACMSTDETPDHTNSVPAIATIERQCDRACLVLRDRSVVIATLTLGDIEVTEVSERMVVITPLGESAAEELGILATKDAAMMRTFRDMLVVSGTRFNSNAP